jgi:hypothetical protein
VVCERLVDLVGVVDARPARRDSAVPTRSTGGVEVDAVVDAERAAVGGRDRFTSFAKTVIFVPNVINSQQLRAMGTVLTRGPHMSTASELRQGAVLVAITGFGVVGYGLSFLYAAYVGTGFEVGVDSLGGVTRADLAASNPEMLHYVDHLHVGLGGLLIALGATLAMLGWYGIRAGYRWAVTTCLVVALIALSTNFLVHYRPGFGYDWLVHIAPSVLVTLLVLVGVARAYQGVQPATGSP